MPADIRNFFGGKPAQTSTSAAKPAKEDPQSVRKRRSRKVVDESDEEEEVQVPASKLTTDQKPSRQSRKKEEPKGEPTTSSDYFASSKKRGFSSKPGVEVEADVAPAKATRTTPRQSVKKTTQVVDDEGLGADDIFAGNYSKQKEDDYVPADSDDDNDFEVLEVKPATASSRRTRAKPSLLEEEGEDDDVVMEDLPKAAPETARASRKRKSEAVIDQDEDDNPPATKKKPVTRAKPSASPAAKKAKSSPKKKDAESENPEIQKIFDSIPTVRPPSPPPDSGEPKKWQYGAQRSRTPPTAGTKDIPVGAENCLAGLSFVFTGILDTLGREEGQELVKKYGGKITTAPSSKTSYVVLGGDAGPKKLQTIAKFNLKTINEDGLFELIRRLPANGGSGQAAEKFAAKKKAEEDKVKKMAAEIDAEEKRKEAEKAKVQSKATANGVSARPSQVPVVDDQLWTTKYAPTSIGMICGNKTAVEKLQSWLRNWHQSAKSNFKKAGKDGSGVYRAVMIHGPPGIGKTTAAHLVAKLEGYDIVETNASDTRSKKLVETGTLGVLDTTSLQGYFAGEGKKVQSEKRNLVLIMDEVDGMSAGDRGGVGAVAAIVKKTNIPIMLICNERRLPKMKPFDHITFDIPFRRPTPDQIRARLSTICFREKMKIPQPVLEALIEGSHADIRQIINMLSAVKVDQSLLDESSTIDFDKGRQMAKAWEKHIILKPWDITSKILSAQMFAPSSTSTLNDKTELYFNDHEFSYLMLQENYLRTKPSLSARFEDPKEKNLKELELFDKAASSISDGDLVDRMIHGTQQQWSLMPTHAIFSFVRPASFAYGNMRERPQFTTWLGQNSKQGKLSRFVKEIQGHMRLRTSGNRDEIRQQYMPMLWDKSVKRLQDEGKECVDEVIDFMDAYFLTRDDFDAMVELGLGPMDQSNVKLDTQTKATFTRLYNSRSHPLPFMKASNVVAPKKESKEKPDVEDVVEESDEEDVVDEVKDEEEDELDLKKDKYVSLPKKKAASAKGKKGKKAATADTDDFVDDSEEKPKKGRKTKVKAKA
ncbi:Replication factor C subunit 1 [Penicillium diatomitis]|uniref:Replication factor C subunit 1 n=1 Tax=Penicillium diatomitis TaxID=2819901 RepID=A0A9W9X6K1_9EURO|nr:Replication factor C subunit 1 [Penicillium diatomitis]KAJ5484129.1 Replication factor C subunit 1 [Penicillium diatomitis]